MLAYDRRSFVNFTIQTEAQTWFDSKLLSQEQYGAICQNFPCHFYAPTLFIRVTLFLATLIAISAGSGLLSLFLPGFSGSFSFAIRFMVFGGAVYWLLEQVVIRQKSFFRAGVDDALLYYALGSMLGGIFLLLASAGLKLPTATYFLIPLPFLAWATIRFTDTLSTVVLFVCFMAFVFFIMLSLGTLGKTGLPFVVMGVSISLLLLSNRLLTRKDLDLWAPNLLILKSLSLATFYLGGNYLIVRELSIALLDTQLKPGADIPFAFLFYFLTVAIPIAFAFQGIRKRDAVFIRMALLALAFAIFTFKHYFVPASYELFLTIIGALMILAAIAIMNYLKQPVNGFTHKSLFRRRQKSLDAEAFLIAESMGEAPSDLPASEPKFGGGQSGGAGAEGEY